MSVAIPIMVFAILILRRHLRDSADATERARTLLLLAAFAVGTALGATEELGKFVGVPPLGSVGMLASTALLTVAALRLRLFERDVSLGATGYLLALTGIGAFATVLTFRYADSNWAMVLLGSATVTLALVASSRRWLAAENQKRARRRELTTLGRFSAQMAHDLKNPLCALKGAAQLLREDVARPTAAVDRLGILQLMLDQIERLDSLVDVYGRLGRIEPAHALLDFNEMVRAVLALQALASDRFTVRIQPSEDLPFCPADYEMLARVLENLVRNAVEAMPEGGTVTVRTMRSALNGKTGIALLVQDTGCGMDARTRERAFDDYFTTKPCGTGLGLAFVRRVVEAHRGEVAIESEPGRGTVVRAWLPAT